MIERKTAFIGVSLKPSERRIIKKASALEGVFESSWVRMIAVERAEQVLREKGANT